MIPWGERGLPLCHSGVPTQQLNSSPPGGAPRLPHTRSWLPVQPESSPTPYLPAWLCPASFLHKTYSIPAPFKSQSGSHLHYKTPLSVNFFGNATVPLSIISCTRMRPPQKESVLSKLRTKHLHWRLDHVRACLCRRQEPRGTRDRAENKSHLIYISPTPQHRFLLMTPC